MSTTFQFPTLGIDLFDPMLIDDVTVVSAAHVLDLRRAVEEVEKSIIGITPLSYSGTVIITSGDNLRTALEKLDYFTAAISTQLGFIFDGYFDGYASRIDTIEGDLHAHRSEDYQIDAYGYSVHGVDGYVVGTLNTQALFNKTIDSGTNLLGPKFIARTSIADVGTRQLEVYSYDGYLSAWIDEQGNARFKDVIIDGYKIQQGIDIVKNSLLVDGYTILGTDTSDYVNILGDLTVAGDANFDSDIFGGQTVDLGDGSGQLNLNFTQAQLTGPLSISDSLTVNGAVNIGDLVGSDPITIKGPIYQLTGVLHNTDGFRALGAKFKVESDTTFVDTTTLNIGALTIVSTTLNIDESLRSFTSNGYNYTFGMYSTKNTNLFAVNAKSLFEEEMTINGDLTLNTGTLTAPQANLGGLQLGNVPTTDGYVWTTTDTLGNGAWEIPKTDKWNSYVVDAYNATSNVGVIPNVVPNVYNALTNDELLINTSYAPFTVFLPSSTLIGTRVRLVDYEDTWTAVKKVIVVPENYPIGLINGSTSLTLTASGSWTELVSNGTNWRIISSIASETGTFAPVLKIGGLTQIITGVVGDYSKVGKAVTITLNLTFTKDGSTGPLTIEGLPFATQVLLSQGLLISKYEGFSAGSIYGRITVLRASMDPNTTTIRLQRSTGTTVTDLDETSILTTGMIEITGTYLSN